ncbi:GGDEF domain-containing protein [Eubacterium limosum]|uniref:GGDEF domain-containing protein n=1 Tax=Eubacterium limosum TaxID=1736 RepID=UPI0022DF511A|nr:GGDEF domain-containing protein [Eubacterium limosum]
MPINLLSLILIALIYFYQNWQFFRYAESVLMKPIKKPYIVLSFFVNYALFMVCSFMQLHLVVNWLLIFVLLLIEILCFFRCPLSDSFVLALISMIIGLALNILFRCLLAAIFDLPLTSFSNNTMNAGNLKRYPVGLGFLAAGLYFHLGRRREAHIDNPRVIFQDKTRKYFLIELSLAIYLYLVLNLLIYSEPGNFLVLKLWGVKSCVFSLLGLGLGVRYAARISRLNHYRALNREVLAELRQKKEEELALSRIASTDALTGCLNRQMAEASLEALLREGMPFCLCFADLNDLKRVNDTLGHEMGDLYLLTAAQTLRRACRTDKDQLYRYGGDEFLILFPGLLPAIASDRLRQVNRGLRARSHMPGHPFDMSVSYGLAQSGEAETPGALIRTADARMYLHKETTERNQNGIRRP